MLAEVLQQRLSELVGDVEEVCIPGVQLDAPSRWTVDASKSVSESQAAQGPSASGAAALRDNEAERQREAVEASGSACDSTGAASLPQLRFPGALRVRFKSAEAAERY